MSEDPVRLTADRNRLTEWVSQFGDAVRGYIFSITQNVTLTEDLTQETFCRIWQTRHKYTEQGTPKAYLFRVADRICMDHFRKNRKEVNLDCENWADIKVSDHTQAPFYRMENQEELVRLRTAMQELSISQQRVLSLRYFSQMSFSEIAEVLEMPLNTVLSHAHRGLALLKKQILND
ncbi:MAG: RNA polymerase sigma factor [Planctomycetia bacterium]|nr:RNA polymerase sigma factor [Planctomycetia bacterium]